MAKNKEQFLITIDKDIKKRLSTYSKKTLIPMSSLVNKLLMEFFEKQN